MTENEKSERDTHFLGFAKLLMAELDSKDYLWPEIRARYEQGIAQRAYDLVYHTRLKTAYGMDLINIKQWIELEVPDMTELPPKKC